MWSCLTRSFISPLPGYVENKAGYAESFKASTNNPFLRAFRSHFRLCKSKAGTASRLNRFWSGQLSDTNQLMRFWACFAAVFEGELGDAGFVEVTEAFGDHAVVLFLCGAGER